MDAENRPEDTPQQTAAGALPEGLRAATQSLDELVDAPLSEHVERYQQIHTGLQDALSGIEGV